jgi:hypothetical protein
MTTALRSQPRTSERFRLLTKPRVAWDLAPEVGYRAFLRPFALGHRRLPGARQARASVARVPPTLPALGSRALGRSAGRGHGDHIAGRRGLRGGLADDLRQQASPALQRVALLSLVRP